MKRITVSMIITVTLAMTAAPLLAGNGYGGGALRTTGCGQIVSDYLASLPAGELSDVERGSLIHMRQEEKLARDVYLTLQLNWGSRIFANIARSEQQHMDMVKMLLTSYGIDDPAADDTIGVFTSEEFQTLYTQLVDSASASYESALTVGATIEDLDIFDLEEALIEIDNADIRFVYQNLLKGSRNHMRAFFSQLQSMGIGYTAQYIGQEELVAIVEADWERGIIVDENGSVLTTCGGAGGANRGGLRRGGSAGNQNSPGTPGVGNGTGTPLCDGSGPGQ